MVILAGYPDRMENFLQSNPGFRSRIAHHIEFPDCSDEELGRIAEGMLDGRAYVMTPAAKAAMADDVTARRAQPHFANARSIRTALDRAGLWQANRLLSYSGPVDADALSTIEEEDIRGSCVFLGGLAHERKVAE